MKLLFIIPSITNYFTFLEGLIDTLTQSGHAVHLATSRKHIARLNAYRRETKCDVHNIQFPRALAPIRHFTAARQVRKLVRELQPDIINIHFSAALFTAMLAKEKDWPPSVGTIHGLGSPLISGWRKRMIAMAEKWSSQRVDEVYVLTKDDGAYLKRMAPKATVHVLDSFGIGCDLKRFNRSNIDTHTVQQIHKELGLTTDDFVYIFIGRQTNFKGFDKVVRAFLKTKKTHIRSKLLLVGEKDRIHPTSLQPKFERALKNDAAILSVGWRENVQDYLAISHLNVFPSEREGLPVNLMESLAMAVPVLTVDSRGCREVVTHNVDGVVLKDFSVKALAQAMQNLQDNPEKLQSMASNALKDRKRFDRSEFISSQLRLIQRLSGKTV